ncbi:MAG: hypothetical protein SF187_24955 [Deltaproteobacteria bacterium]|nr:hypothetical protein [Deltaproteobacteria bacterium]
MGFGRVCPSARRVALFAGDPTAASFTEAGGRLFDAAVTWATRTREMLFVVGNAALSPVDQALLLRATKLGFGVHVRDGANAQVSDTSNKALVLISESTLSATVDARLRNIAVPALCLEPALFDEFGMTGDVWLTNYGLGPGRLVCTPTATPKSGPAETLFDDLLISEGQCPVSG